MSGLLVVTAVVAERDAVAESVSAGHKALVGPYQALRGRSVTVIAGGVGPASAAAATATALSLAETPGTYSLVVCAGIGGAFAGRAAVGEVVEATVIVAADLGVGLSSGFAPITDLGFGFVEVPGAALGISTAMRGPIFTVSTVTATEQRADELAAQGGYVEAMEGFGVAVAAVQFGLPVAELRAISNLVGERDRESWDLEGAIGALAAAASALPGAVG